MSTVRATLWSNMGEAVQFRNVFTYNHPTNALGDGDKVRIAARISDMWAVLLPFLSTVFEAQGVHFEELVEGVWQPRGEVEITGDGLASTEVLPFMNSGLVLALTGFAKTMGKKYIGGFTEAVNIDGAFGPAAIVALTSFLGYYLGSVGGGADPLWTAGTVSKTGVFHAFIGGRVADLFATQRRRHPSVGI